MASDAPSWADQWGAGGIGVMAEEENPAAKKEMKGGRKGGAKAGLNRAKMAAFISVKFIKNLLPKKKKKSSTSS